MSLKTMSRLQTIIVTLKTLIKEDDETDKGFYRSVLWYFESIYSSMQRQAKKKAQKAQSTIPP